MAKWDEPDYRELRKIKEDLYDVTEDFIRWRNKYKKNLQYNHEQVSIDFLAQAEKELIDGRYKVAGFVEAVDISSR